MAYSGPRHNLTLRNAAQCTGSASGGAAHQSTAQRAALTHKTLGATERTNLSVQYTVLRCERCVVTSSSITNVLSRSYITSSRLHVHELDHARFKSHTSGQMHSPPTPTCIGPRWKLAFAVRDRRLTAWPMERPTRAFVTKTCCYWKCEVVMSVSRCLQRCYTDVGTV